MNPESNQAAASRVEDSTAMQRREVDWRRVHPFTPVANSFTVILTFVVVLLTQIGNFHIEKLLQYFDETGTAALAVLVSVAVVAVILALVILVSYLQWRFIGYAVMDDSVVFRKGIIFKSERELRLKRIQAVDVVAPLLPRLIGLGKLHIDVAGASDSKIDIAYLKLQKCQELRVEILARAAGAKRGDAPDTAASPTMPVQQTEPGGLISQTWREVGSSGVVGSLPVAVGEAPEIPLYQVETPMLLRSILRSALFWFILGFALLCLTVVIVAIVIVVVVVKDEEKVDFGSFLFALLTGWGALLLGAVSVLWKQLNVGWGFTAAISPDGIRLRHGLTTHESQTIPPGRIHAVVLRQPFLWRKKDWWNVRLTMAGYQGEEKDSKRTTHVFLPVGTRRQALSALWMVERNLGEVIGLDGKKIGTGGTELIETLMYGTGEAPGLYVSPPQDRWLDWITWKRRAAVLTTTVTMIRSGRIIRRVSFVPHTRIQSLEVRQGPLERLLHLSTVGLNLVPGIVPTKIRHLEQQQAYGLWNLQVQYANAARATEPPEEWLSRVVSTLTQAETESRVETQTQLQPSAQLPTQLPTQPPAQPQHTVAAQPPAQTTSNPEAAPPDATQSLQ